MRRVHCPTPETEWLVDAAQGTHLPGTVVWCEAGDYACGAAGMAQSTWATLACIGEPVIVTIPEPTSTISLLVGCIALAGLWSMRWRK